MSTRRWLLGAVLGVSACASAPPPHVDLAAGWPEKPLAYDDAFARWTRHAEYSADWRLIVRAQATLFSPEWRAAFVAERARRQPMSSDEQRRLTAAEQAADTIDLELLLVTNRPDWNDLIKGERSIWRVSLTGDDGREVLPASVKEDRRPFDAVTAWFPNDFLFQRAYLVKFPRKAADGKPMSEAKLTLRISSGLGAIDMVWE